MRLNIYFKCARCHGTGQATPTSECPDCKGKGIVLHMFKDVLRFVEFPDPRQFDQKDEVAHD